MNGINKLRMLMYVVVAAAHGLLIFFLVFKMDALAAPPEPPPQVIKLVDVEEDIPPPPPPPPPPPQPVEPQQNAVEAIAEKMIETDKVPENQVIVDRVPVQSEPVQTVRQEIEYLPQNKVSKIPSLSDADKRKIMQYLKDNYPPIPLRSGLNGLVVLDLAVDSQGAIRQITVFKEDPAERGFGEVAVNAFKGIRMFPAEFKNKGEEKSVPVAARFRYPIRFTVK
jgi:protein TonB